VISRWRGAPAAVATKHRKTATVGGGLAGATGMALETCLVDTDRLGTFSGVTRRAGTAEDAVVAKADWACRESGRDLGIGSEGSFRPHPEVGLVTVQVELVALVDRTSGLTVVGRAGGPAAWARTSTHAASDDLAGIVGRYADLLASGTQRVLVRPDPLDPADRGEGVHLGIRTPDRLRAAVCDARAHSPNGRVVVETDLRAHVCPPRRRLIAEAAADLGRRLLTACPECGSPGFGTERSVRGAPCAWCGGPTATPHREVSACPTCRHRETRTIPGSEPADPGTCPACNP